MPGFLTSACANAGNSSTKRCRWFGAPTVVLGGNRRSEQLQLIARVRKLRRIELCKIVAAIGSDDVLDDTCGVCVSMISAS
jgi:hypothetical protein